VLQAEAVLPVLCSYPECVSAALDIQHAMRTCRIVLLPVVCPAVPCFFT